jgi:hypothetical protein
MVDVDAESDRRCRHIRESERLHLCAASAAPMDPLP